MSTKSWGGSFFFFFFFLGRGLPRTAVPLCLRAWGRQEAWRWEQPFPGARRHEARVAISFSHLPVARSAAAVALIAIKFVTVFSGSHPHTETPHVEYTYIRHKPFPWGDGNTSLFSPAPHAHGKH